MDAKILGLLGGLAGYLAGLYIVGTQNPSSVLGISLVTAGLILISVSAPALGYLMRVFSGRGGFPSMREHMVFTALGFYIATAAMLMIYLGYSGWRVFAVAVSLIIAIIPVFTGKR